MSDFTPGSYVTAHFIDGTAVEFKLISLHVTYFVGINSFGHTVLIPFDNVKYLESKAL
ncbi:hypothetical protein J7E81_11900 [Bacillus sp. ISL-18]|uniref:hypothetical protein n=1 Tax=Bacillaceae TaxID=186817 RepID=UPI001BE976A1|nr:MULTISPECIES: hypothetical protein [Bacillaceae]MBT2655928.1 hypothetical protein [Bacillus sp. ISL-18]ULT59448.1 hypothetical protein L1999_13355 [Neobacillus drentensis]